MAELLAKLTFKRLFLIFLGIVIVAVGVGVWSWQKNLYTKGILKFEILAPNTANVGDEVTYTVQYKNNGDVELKNVKLSFQYPDGTIPSGGAGMRVEQNLDPIYPGNAATVTFKGRLFGTQGEVKQAKADITFSPQNLSTTNTDTTTASTVIASAPVSFDIDIPSQVQNNQPITFNINYSSLISYPLANLRVRLTLPDGFTATTMNPQPVGNNEWALPVLNQADGGRISITGTLNGDANSNNVYFFKADIGTWNNGQFTLLKEVNKGVQISQPNILITQSINGSDSTVASAGDLLHYVVTFKNISNQNLQNLFLAINLKGRPYDLNSIKMTTGHYTQGDNSLVWEAQDNPKLQFLGQGEQGQVEFWVNVQKSWDVYSPQETNFQLVDTVTLAGVSQEFDTKVNADLGMTQKGYFNNSAFTNTGPIPPKVGLPTTYTITWKATDAYNDVNDAKVTATLPNNVNFTGTMQPSDANLTYDSKSRELVWDIGNMTAGAGSFTSPPTVSFQIQLTPSPSQRGSSAPLIGDATITGQDSFTQQNLQNTAKGVDTTLPADSTITPDQGNVQ